MNNKKKNFYLPFTRNQLRVYHLRNGIFLRRWRVRECKRDREKKREKNGIDLCVFFSEGVHVQFLAECYCDALEFESRTRTL